MQLPTIVVLACLSFLRPLWGVYLFVLMIPLEDVLLVVPSVTLLKVVGVFAFAGWFARMAVSRPKADVPRAVIVALLFLGWALASLLWARDPTLGLGRWMTAALLVGFFFLVPQLVTDWKKLHYVILSYVGGAMIAGGAGVYQFLLNPNRRIVAFAEFGDNAGTYGISISLGIFYFLALFLSTSKRTTSILSLAGLFFLCLPAFASGTRTFVLSFGVSLGVLFWHLFSRRHVHKGFTAKMGKVSIPLLAIIGVIALMPSFWGPRMVEVRSASGWSGRADIWRVYGTVVLQHPVLGVGLENTWPFFGDYIQEAKDTYGVHISNVSVARSTVKDVHNISLKAWAQLGIVGFALLLLLIGLSWKQAYRSLRKTRSGTLEWRLGLVIVLYLVSLFAVGIGEPVMWRKYFWFGLALATTYGRIISSRRLYAGE